ncbi:MAG: extracellular solute-binding protein [Sneathiellaceae bacterium]
MKRAIRSLAAAAVAATLAGAAAQPAAAEVELVVQYTQPQIFDGVFARLKEEFEAQNPDVTVKFRGPLKDYGAGIQALLREAVIDDMPHVDYLGLSHLPVVADRGLAVDLGPLMAADGSSFEENGWTESLQSLGRVDGRQLALPFAISMSLAYYNADLVRQVGGDPENMPRDWPGIIVLAGRVAALGPDYAGMYIPYSAGWYGAWYFQGVLFSHGGEMMQPGATRVAFSEDPAWQKAVGMYDSMAEQGGMKPLADQAQRQQFIAGKMGFVIDSISRLYGFQKAIGDRFDLRTARHPMAAENGRLPTGGNLALITTAAEKDPAVLDAAWRWLKFSTGPYGTTQVIKLVGYTPVNVLALEDPQLLKGYFDDRPQHRTAVEQIPLVREWYQYPGDNSLKIDDVIGEHLEAVVDNSMTPDEALASLTEEVNRLLPAQAGN